MSQAPLLAITTSPPPHAGQPAQLPHADSLAAFGWRVSRQLAQCRRENGQLALLWVEIDVMPPSDDNLDLSDKDRDTLIRAVSSRLRNRVRSTDEVVRMGPCSFAVLLLAAGAPEADLVEQRLLQALKGPYGLAGRLPRVNLRIGTALFPQAGRSGAELARVARDNLPEAAPA